MKDIIFEKKVTISEYYDTRLLNIRTVCLLLERNPIFWLNVARYFGQNATKDAKFLVQYVRRYKVQAPDREDLGVFSIV